MSTNANEIDVTVISRLGDVLLRRNAITEQQLEEALRYQRRFGGRLGDILIELGFLSRDSLALVTQDLPEKERLGDLLVREGHLTPDQLHQALAFQAKSGGKLGDILLSLRFMEAEALYRAIANQFRIGRIGSHWNFDFSIKISEQLARECEAVVIYGHYNRFTVAVSEPLSDEMSKKLVSELGKPIEQVLATRDEMEKLWSLVYETEMIGESIDKLAKEQPHNSASVTFTKPQLISFIVAFALFVVGLALNFMTTVIIVSVIVQVFYFLMTALKFLIVMYGSRTNVQSRFSDELVGRLDERELPLYTILVPMYKESEVIPSLIRNLDKLDYPKAKLDIRLLIEEDDTDAQRMLHDMDLPSYYTTLIVPDSLPKTKPKACNYGLIRARGEYVVIYDAEDRPDPDQLKKVILTFRDSPATTACVQAKLNYFNSRQNLLTKWFTQEYSMWFELLLPGIMKLGIPVPLGGTSNHFKTDVLKKLNAWDPYNVTEDADLGVRLYKEGYSTAIVDSRTWEEANSRFGNWIRQRSRWIKGYMQTWLVHMRNPIKLYKELGFKGFVGFQVMLLASPAIPLLNPLFWLLIVLWYGWKPDFIMQLFPGPIYYMAAIEFMLGNFFFIFSSIVGVYWIVSDTENKGQDLIPYSLVRYTLLLPLYWVMMSIASYKAAWQLITKPFYWEKTIHGLDHAESESA
ncbi:glycosyltransferase [Cohnella endophytica]|uniref:Glycosyltransferase n=1 Tax=Cohnella endophytica TaxID=2419778 RepID=A0A494XXL1_9BACL|nr:glycosyltransferase family 2 protein [Cohnella endophytica]RKP55232.1 glycosyltransferase [Cohnella endophytica]